MAEGSSREKWNHTSALLAMQANCHRGKGRKLRPGDFHPHQHRRKKQPTPKSEEGFQLLKRVFVDNKKQ